MSWKESTGLAVVVLCGTLELDMSPESLVECVYMTKMQNNV